MNIETIWTDAHAPKVNQYLLRVETKPGISQEVSYTEVVVNGNVESYRVEDSRHGLITDSRIINAVCRHVEENPGPPKG